MKLISKQTPEYGLPEPAAQLIAKHLLHLMTTQPRKRTTASPTWLVTAFSLLAFGLSANAANIWYVDPAAPGPTHNGSSWNNAWTSLTSVSGVSAGDTVYISGGASGQTYSVSSWSPASGTAGNPVVYRVGQDASHNGMVTFSGAGSSSYLIYQAGNYYTIDGRYNGLAHLTLANYGNFPIYYGNNNNGTPRGVTYLGMIMSGGFQLSNAGSYEIGWCTLQMPDTSDHAIFLGGSYVPQGGTWGVNKIHNNTIAVSRTPSGNLNSAGGNGDDGIQWGNSVDIYSNYFYTVSDASYPGTQHQDFIQGDGQYIRIFANTFENSGESCVYPDITGSSHAHLWIYNNVFMITTSAITSATRCIDDGPDTSGATISDHVIANNTFIGFNYMNVRMYSANTFVNSMVVNNIFMDCSAGLTLASGVTVAYNCYGGTSPNSGGTGSQVGTPAFVKYSRLTSPVDLHLLASDTKALGKGTSSPSSMFTVDKDGVTRPLGQAWAIGAYELAASGPSTNAVIAVNPSSQNFSSVGVGTTKDLTFTVQNVGGGTLAGAASVPAPFSVVNGGTYSLGSNQSQTVTVRYTPTAAGNSSQNVTFSGGGGTTAAVVGTGYTLLSGLSFQSYAGTITSPFVANGAYISQSTLTGVIDGGRAVYGFDIVNAGDYTVSANVIVPDTSANSVFLSIDADPTDPSDIWDMQVSTTVTNEVASWRGTGADGAPQYAPAVFTLTAGTHYLVIVGREPGVEVGQITIALYGSSRPSLPPAPLNLHIVAGP